MALAHEKLSYAIIGSAMDVHRELGPGVDEMFYHQRMSERLRETGIEHLYKPRRELVHRGIAVDVFEPDLVFPDRLVAELKWLWNTFPPECFVQLTCYLKFWKISDALLFDFGKESVVHKRFVLGDKSAVDFDVAEALGSLPAFVDDRPLANGLCESLSRIVVEHGLGYRDTTYRGLLAAELLAEGVALSNSPKTMVRCGDRCLGSVQLQCIAVPNKCAIMTVAWRAAIRAADRAILQSWLRHLELPWGLVINFGKTQVQLQWVSGQSHKDSGRNMD